MFLHCEDAPVEFAVHDSPLIATFQLSFTKSASETFQGSSNYIWEMEYSIAPILSRDEPLQQHEIDSLNESSSSALDVDQSKYLESIHNAKYSIEPDGIRLDEWTPDGTAKFKDDEYRDYVRMRMKERESEYTTMKGHRFMCITWNVNCKRPGPENIHHSLELDPTNPIELYAIGLQEVDMSAEAVVLNDISRGKPWEEYFHQQLNSSSLNYDLLSSRQIGGILLLLFVHSPVAQWISEIRTSIVGVGLLGLLGNKGAVAIRFLFRDSVVCIVNSHLAATKDNVEGRNQDYHDIVQRVNFCELPDIQGIFDTDVLIWIGDLNYRVDLSNEAIRSEISSRNWKKLLENDQLVSEIRAGRAFNDFSEGLIAFAPTYKYDTGSDEYDTSEKRRAPAYCDRILWWNRSPVDILSYYRAELKLSDHRPVLAHLGVGIRIEDKMKRLETSQRIARDVDKAENLLMPQATLSSTCVDFETVRYMVPVVRTITIENHGTVISRFRFIPKNNDKSATKPWLSVDPKIGKINPGEKVDIELTIYVDFKTAPLLNIDRDKIEDILVLSLIRGKHYFISISGRYLRSCFAMSIQNLLHMIHPVRTCALPPEADCDSLEPPLLIPKELWRIVDYMFKTSLREDGLFLKDGILQEVEQIRECLDTCQEFSLTLSPHSMAECLIRWLESLPESVIPPVLYQKTIENCGNYHQLKSALVSMPTTHHPTFIYIISFLRELLKHSKYNKLSAEKLALVFSNVMIRSPYASDALRQSDIIVKKKALVLLHFLTDGVPQTP
eukprot:TRINITY_DN1540_c1_g1_i13.p1 TRINITY_DN1540_c1_g1~~TRINITY_DN1540_c1_g1_i13.p1  ORF type:complete len:781 (-),score=100.23 TRINITY_DN1540_c1_g1_i13:309-2651(-)